ncbi:cobyrinate a,c-diamide synthase [Salinibius halmophilus]|uniref:cobyrinate a,c-diamide synthase n=1 Tax=Salinibius halmophilus TaxID=1853216 RepID=UPI001F3F860F|nr:cobyrinate a,c-diamide synthase [Salinibius halmophilus]
MRQILLGLIIMSACHALFIAAPASGQGKTTITAALARLLVKQGKTVRVFKTGPDYLDPQILALASGAPVVQLDLWMAGEAWCRAQLNKAAQEADVILVEGVMGLFDGTPSSADLAATFGIPIALLMDVSGMAQTAAAVAVGLANYRDDYSVAGLIANQCGSVYHQQLITDALPDDLPLITGVLRNNKMTLPERHLGLVQVEEMADELNERIDAGAQALDAEALNLFLQSLPKVAFSEGQEPTVEQWLAGKTIAIAKDAAFSFIYAANTELLQAMGAKLVYFSPLRNEAVPTADALWLPGGYPELHSEVLSQNTQSQTSILQMHQQGRPILAECGGMLYCLTSLRQLDGSEHPMLGLLAGQGQMRERGGCQGMQSAPLPSGLVRGHAHHRSTAVDTPEPYAHGQRQKHPAPGEPIYRQGSLTASYLHLFFPSNPKAIAQLFAGS